VRVLYGEGVADYTGPESCAAVREERGEALTGECVGQPLSGENQLRGADVLRPAEGNTARVANARHSPTPRRRRARQAGELGSSQSGRFVQALAAADLFVRLKLNTTNLEPIELERESGKFKGAWHHAAAVLGGAVAAPMR
jgi:hypothetical protein